VERDGTRRGFLKRLGLAAAIAAKPINRLFAKGLETSAFAAEYVPPTGRIRLPESDDQWQAVKDYISDPGPEYRHASESAFEAFRDIKYGVRIHWGLYSKKEWWDTSWPFLKLSPAEKQEYQEQYKTWNPSGFNADEWMRFFQENGMKMFAITCNHHDGFSMYNSSRRVTSRVDWTAPGGPKLQGCDLAYSIMETPFSRDVVGELCAAGR
jgi:alpha-L-fucosidase